MSEYMVDVALNANVDGYVQGIGQAVAATKQYVGVADGMNGRLADLNSAMVGLTNRVTGFNKVNTVALDQAAAYQKALSGVEAKATLSGKSFDALSKSTKAWAREFPIGLGRAVEVMTSLQQAGIKTEKQMGSLGQSFIKLGAATGANAAAIGSEFLQLSRTMGNGIGQFEKLSDSLVSTTAKIGGSAPAVVAFSKALAPVAATVGLSQTAVIGLSASMSRLGEDGYQAANSLNKVLLDMNRSIRDGGPELKAYADLMGMTSKQLRDLFKSDPSEVVSRFAEAVAKEGPNISRTLDLLGFDSVRTTRSLTALARSGGPRAAISAAVSGYGDGSSARAAEVAMEGVADQAEKLQESMSQVVASVGQPLLGVAKVQLQMANQVSGVLAKATESDAGQAVLSGGSALSLGGGIASNLMLVGGALALRRMAFGPTSAYGAGRAFGLSGQALPEGAGPMARIGAGTAGLQAAMFGPLDRNGGPTGGMAGRLVTGANRLTSFALQAAVKANDSLNTNFVARTMGMPVYVTAQGQQLAASSKEFGRAVLDGARTGDFDRAIASSRGMFADTRAMIRQMSTAGVGMGTLGMARSVGTAVLTNGAIVAADGTRMLGRAGAALGRAGLSPAMLGVGAAIAGGTYLSDQFGKQDAALTRVRDGSEDIYGQFNSFAEASGMAGKGLVAFQAQVERTTETLVSGNDTLSKSFQLSASEMQQAMSSSYKPAFQVAGDDFSVRTVAAQAKALLGSNARPQEIARLGMDVANQTNASTAQQVLAELERDRGTGGDMPVDYQALVDSLTSNKNDFLNFVNDEQGKIGTAISNAAQQRSTEAGRVYGGSAVFGGRKVGAGQAVALGEARKIYEAALASPTTVNDSAQQAVVNAALQEVLGFNEQQAIAAGIGTDWMSTQGVRRTALAQGLSFDEFMRGAAGMDQAPDQAANYAEMRRSGYDFASMDMSRFRGASPANEQESRDLQDAFARVTGASARLTDSLYGADKAAREFATMPSMLTDSQLGTLTRESRLVQEYERNPTDSTRVAAGRALADQAMAGTRNPTEALQLLQVEGAKTEEGYKKDVVSAATELASRDADLYYSGARAADRALDAIRSGVQAQALSRQPGTPSAVSQQYQASISVGMQAQAGARNDVANLIRSYGAMQAQIGSIQRSSGIAAGAVARDARLGEQYAIEDRELQRTYARQDFRSMQRRAVRDFATGAVQQVGSFTRSRGYAQEDYERQQRFATEGFNRQMGYQQADFDKAQLRAQEDYLTARTRATRDYQVSVQRSTRDFNRSQERAQADFDVQQGRALADFNRGKLRMTQDFDRQVSRMTEDSAKAMYDPYKRIAAQMVMDAGQLVSNLRDQADAIGKQVGNLADARSLGVSEQAIKQLGLADAGNAQQLSRLVDDLRQNGDMAAQLNEAVSSRFDAGSALASDAGNVAMQRAREDFATSQARYQEDFDTAMGRSTEDFAKSKSRALEDFTTSMGDAAADFGRSLGDMEADFNRSMGRSTDDFGVSVARAREQFAVEMAQMAEVHTTQMNRSMGEFMLSMQQSVLAFATQMDDAKKDYDKANRRADEGLKIAIERMRERAKNAISDIGAQAAAQIKSMEESFVQLHQQAPKDPVEAARRAREILYSLGIDESLWGDEISRIMDLAWAEMNRDLLEGIATFTAGRKAKGKDAGTASGGASTNERPKPKSPMDELFGSLQGLASADLPTADLEQLRTRIGDAFSGVATAAIDGFKEGFLGSWGDAGTGTVGTVLAGFSGIVESIKRLWGIQSPSTVFKQIGEDVVEGLKQGLASLASLDFAGDVEKAFGGARQWLSDLKDKAARWVGSAWDSLVAPLSKLDVEAEVLGAFSGAKKWLGGLKGWLGEAIGEDGWSGLWSGLPTKEQALEKLKGVFVGEDGTFQGWLKGLPAWMRENIPGADKFLETLSPLTDAFKQAFSMIIDMWNKMDLRLSMKWDGFTIPRIGEIKVGDKVIFPGGGPWPNVGAFTVGPTPDLFPNIPNPFQAKPRALGGIITRPELSLIAEAGYPEAVIPLNQRGADVLAATMARYVDQSQARQAMVGPYASGVVNNYSSSVYDQSTQFNGPITVKAEDPDVMAQRLAARARRSRLAQPVGAGR